MNDDDIKALRTAADMQGLSQEFAELVAERDAAVDDADRMDFISNEWFYKDMLDRIAFSFNESWNAGQHESLRAAIDAAMATARIIDPTPAPQGDTHASHD
jgi:hypothetical protein